MTTGDKSPYQDHLYDNLNVGLKKYFWHCQRWPLIRWTQGIENGWWNSSGRNEYRGLLLILIEKFNHMQTDGDEISLKYCTRSAKAFIQWNSAIKTT